MTPPRTETESMSSSEGLAPSLPPISSSANNGDGNNDQSEPPKRSSLVPLNMEQEDEEDEYEVERGDASPSSYNLMDGTTSNNNNNGRLHHHDSPRRQKRQRNQSNEISDDIPSNERLLGTAFISFMSFSLLQLVFAFIAGSQAMVGDSAAMMVDALTYLFNWIAERRKTKLEHITSLYEVEGIGRNESNDLDRAEEQRRLSRWKRKMILQLEIIPPIISVTCLLAVIVVVLERAIRILMLDLHRSRSEQLNPNVGLMFAFSIFNLVLDGLNVFCFAKAKHLLGYETFESNPSIETATDGATPPRNRSNNGATRKPSALSSQMRYGHVSVDEDSLELGTLSRSPMVVSPPPSPDVATSTKRIVNPPGLNGTRAEQDENSRQPNVESTRYSDNPSSSTDNNDEGSDEPTTGSRKEQEEEENRANLNMCSAYTHVFADTLRSIAVIVAAALAEVVPDVTPEEADATAAVVVSILILLSLVPLFQGLLKSLSELQAIRAEERSEQLFPTSEISNAPVC